MGLIPSSSTSHCRESDHFDEHETTDLPQTPSPPIPIEEDGMLQSASLFRQVIHDRNIHQITIFTDLRAEAFIALYIFFSKHDVLQYPKQINLIVEEGKELQSKANLLSLFLRGLTYRESLARLKINIYIGDSTDHGTFRYTDILDQLQLRPRWYKELCKQAFIICLCSPPRSLIELHQSDSAYLQGSVLLIYGGWMNLSRLIISKQLSSKTLMSFFQAFRLTFYYQLEDRFLDYPVTDPELLSHIFKHQSLLAKVVFQWNTCLTIYAQQQLGLYAFDDYIAQRWYCLVDTIEKEKRQFALSLPSLMFYLFNERDEELGVSLVESDVSFDSTFGHAIFSPANSSDSNLYQVVFNNKSEVIQFFLKQLDSAF
jgi:hypothetical protein